MFGYVRPSLRHLTEEDEQLFRAVYCGLCRTLGQRYGLASRFILNYDLAFLALLLSEPEKPELLSKNCIAHPFHAREYCPGNEALELAADCSVILSWWQIRDALSDGDSGKKAKHRAAELALKSAYRRARELRPEFDRLTRQHLEELSTMEKDNCPSMDLPADRFARLLQAAAGEVAQPVKRRVLEQILYHLGRWIYLVDAADDLKKDFETGSYNPLIHRFSLESGVLTGEARETLVVSLDHSIRLMAAAFELWDFGVWSNIIRSVVYEGLFCVGNAVLEGTFHADAPPFGEAGRNKEPL